MKDSDELIQQRQVAARLAARAEIRDVRLLRTRAELHRIPEPGRALRYDMEIDPNVDWDAASPSSFVVRSACRLAIDFGDEESRDASMEPEEHEQSNKVRDGIASLDFEYAALFDCEMRPDDEPLEEAELIAYASTTGHFALYPYIREYVYDLTGRLTLPPLTLGVLSLPINRPDDAD